MRIAFADFIDWDYKVESAYKIPMGGTQSTLCYLAEALAQQGHDVFLLNNTSTPGMSRGVLCLSWATTSMQMLRSLELDALVIVLCAGFGVELRSFLSKNTRLILWTGHAHDQSGVQALHDPAERNVYDGIALVSNWQRDRFYETFGIDLARTWILHNAIGPFFCGLFPDGAPLLAQKSKPPVLAYTSTPFRGLDILLQVFPRIRRAVPGTRLKVFSSMKVYQVSETDDESEYGLLYHKCQETEGVEYIGSLPQPDLARELRSVMVLAYPNTFAETSCIAVMEAMASGCWIITSDLGALPGTTAGFARLVPVQGNWEAYKESFVEETVQVLRECTGTDTTDAETHLRLQVTHINSAFTWSIRAQQWVQWLSRICVKTAGAVAAMPLNSGASSTELQQQAYQCLIQGEYTQAVALYEQAIKACPTVIVNYWYLGLTFLLQGQEIEAQTTWTLAMVNGEPEQVDMWIAELIQVLQSEAIRRRAMADYQNAELIEQCIREISPDCL